MKQQARARRARRAGALIGLAAACALPAATPAQAQAPASAGGAFASSAATIQEVSCETRCAGAADHGSRIRVRGRGMRDVHEVVFLGGAGSADDVVAEARDVTATSVAAKVPDGATTGPVLVRNGDGQASAPSKDALIVGEPLPEDPDSGPGAARLVADTERSPLVEATVEAHTVLYAGARAARLRLTGRGDEPVALTVALVRAADRAVVRRWSPKPLAPGASLSVTWDGTIGGKVPTRRGRYQFQVWRAEPAQETALRSAPDPEAASSFDFVPYVFPIAGKHQFGDGAAAFGGGRGHQGHDVFAACGTPLVAARGGVVKKKAYHARAGHYVVIDADGTGYDMAYMHLRSASPLREGDRVGTGERIGEVGDTGRASGCHLHFELWTAPGWYEGGHPIDPLPALKAWDAWTTETAARRRR